MVQNRSKSRRILVTSRNENVVPSHTWRLCVNVPACSREHAEDSRILGDNRVICEAISVHDTALTAVTIKPHNRTLDHDRDRPEEGFDIGSPSSMCPNTSSNAPKPRRTDRPKPSYLRILN